MVLSLHPHETSMARSFSGADQAIVLLYASMVGVS